MKVCKHCATENRNDRLTCENCGHYLPAPDPATQSLKPKRRVTSAKTVKPHKPRKEVEYVRLSHGRVMKKSTYDWIQRRDSGFSNVMWFIFGISILAALIKGCS
jgi:hypothetical protein